MLDLDIHVTLFGTLFGPLFGVKQCPSCTYCGSAAPHPSLANWVIPPEHPALWVPLFGTPTFQTCLIQIYDSNDAFCIRKLVLPKGHERLLKVL